MTRRPPFLDESTPRLRHWFEAPTHDAWRAAAERTRCDPDVTRKLGHGIALSPLAPASSGAPVQARHVRDGAWDVRALVEQGTLAEATQQIATDLGQGATSVWIRPTGGARGLAAGAGLAVMPEMLSTLLASVDLANTPIHITGGLLATDWYDALVALSGESWVTVIDDLAGACFAADVALPADAWDATAARVKASDPRHRVVGVSTVAWEEAGGTKPQQLGLAVAALAEALRELDARDVSAEDTASRLVLQVAVGSRTFLEIASIRALRDLTTRLLELCGVRSTLMLHAVSSANEQSALDPWSNALRGTSAVFAAAVAGADAITMRPHDAVRGSSVPAAQRLSATGQVVLARESHLARVVDPSAGAGHIERLTAEMCQAAWHIFQSIEELGGLTAAIASGHVARELAASRDKTAFRIATRRQVRVGVNAFPDPDTTPMVSPGRPDSAWEALRVRASNGSPVATIVPIGEPKGHRARVRYSEMVFAAGGFATRVGDDIEGIAVVAGSNEDLAEALPDLIGSLRQRGAKAVIIAGPAHDAADGTIAAGTDLLATFHTCLDALGVSA